MASLFCPGVCSSLAIRFLIISSYSTGLIFGVAFLETGYLSGSGIGGALSCRRCLRCAPSTLLVDVLHLHEMIASNTSNFPRALVVKSCELLDSEEIAASHEVTITFWNFIFVLTFIITFVTVTAFGHSEWDMRWMGSGLRRREPEITTPFVRPGRRIPGSALLVSICILDDIFNLCPVVNL
ncbi:hypothetical protein K432DRAFT_196592 [Lepidopterella palustris CBS 459.81]|uniref:Uncharacterized protein n=1 Tax=Lepidopterella palustris CBS 459.81 TaxID=1314670 RepID=A0A8E2EFL0_9PEZI|nr:hypothetical protein K432DRAFT_196592 [Lepidopterella palustris CBS 459.81]